MQTHTLQHLEPDANPGYTTHIEPITQGGQRYIRCEGCGRELLTAYGGRDKLVHKDACPNADGGSDGGF